MRKDNEICTNVIQLPRSCAGWYNMITQVSYHIVEYKLPRQYYRVLVPMWYSYYDCNKY